MYRRSTLFLAASTSAFQMAALGRASKVRRLASFHDFEEHLLAPSADEQGELVSMASYKGAHPVSFRVASDAASRDRAAAPSHPCATTLAEKSRSFAPRAPLIVADL
jgi:hypothetical protein